MDQNVEILRKSSTQASALCERFVYPCRAEAERTDRVR